MEEHQLPDLQSPNVNNARVFVILGWVFTGLTLILSYFSMIVAVIMGILAIVRGAKTQGIWIIIVSVVLAILMTILGMYVLSWFAHNAPNVIPPTPNTTP